MKAQDFITELASKGRYYFTLKEVEEALGVSAIATRSALRRLKEKGEICLPFRGFYLIVPAEYRSLGCLPPDQFIPNLMQYLKESYYVGLLSAAQYYGAAHQQPQQFQVIVARNRSAIECGKVRILFIARKNIIDMPIKTFNTPRGIIKVSTPEVTAMDLITYPQHSGGIGNIITVLEELIEQLNPDVLAKLAASSQDTTWIQRLGYLLMKLNADTHFTDPLAKILKNRKLKRIPLAVGQAIDEKSYNAEWHIIENIELESDL